MSKRSQRRARAARNESTRARAEAAGATAVPTELLAGDGGPLRAGPAPSPAPPPAATASSALTPAGAHPPPGIRWVETPEEARSLADRLREGELTWPVAVVTTARGRERPYVDAERLATDVAGLAEVVVLPTGAPSWAFSGGLPDMTQVFGGASRVYGPDRAWLTDPYASPLRFAFTDGDGAHVLEKLASDVARFAFSEAASPSPTHGRPAAGVVIGHVASRGWVRLDDGGDATIWAELTVPGVPIEALVGKGQRVRGELDPETRRLDIRAMVDDAVGPVIGEPAQHVPVRIEDVTPDAVVVAIVPGHDVTVPASRAVDDGAVLGARFAPGDVVVGTWWTGDEGSGPELRLDMWDGEEDVTPAPPLLPGGPSWLALPEDGVPEVPPGTEDEAPLDPADKESVELARMRTKLRAKEAENEKLRAERTRLRREDRAARAGRRARGGQSPSSSSPSFEGAFLDPDEQFRFEVYVEWAVRIPAAQKAEHRLRDYTLGERFLPSLDELEGVSRSKVVQVVVEVLSGLAPTLAGRDLHQLRTSEGGGTPATVRSDGATCWRAALQRETASARRLHYWELVDNTVELSRVVKHDDVEP